MKYNQPEDNEPKVEELIRRIDSKFVYRPADADDTPEIPVRKLSSKDNNPYKPMPCMSSSGLIPPQKPRMELEEGCPNFGGGIQERMIPEENDYPNFSDLMRGEEVSRVEPEPMPVKNELPYMWPKAIDRIIEIAKQRDEFGEKKYGTRLQPFNGRDPLVDAFQEGLDKLVYIEQELFERPYKEAVLNAAMEIVNYGTGDARYEERLAELFRAVWRLNEIQGK